MHPNTLRSCKSHDFETRNVGSGDAPWIPNLEDRKFTTGALLRPEGASIDPDLFCPAWKPLVCRTLLTTPVRSLVPHPWLPETVFLYEPTR